MEKYLVQYIGFFGTKEHTSVVAENEKKAREKFYKTHNVTGEIKLIPATKGGF
jgi:FMN-dependent NADH-azoreductase